MTASVIFWLVLVVSLAMWPIFLIVVALFNTVMPAFQPAVLVRIIGEIPREYAWCVLFSTICFLGGELVTLPFLAEGHALAPLARQLWVYAGVLFVDALALPMAARHTNKQTCCRMRVSIRGMQSVGHVFGASVHSFGWF